MSTHSSQIRHQMSLNFWEEIQRRKIPTFLSHDNQRFAHELILEDFFEKDEDTQEFLITENIFRRFSGVGCRNLNGYCRLAQRGRTRYILLFRKPFNSSDVSVSVVGEFLVVHAHHNFIWELLQSPADYEEQEEPFTERVKETGKIARTLVRRYMLPSNCDINRDITWVTRGDLTEIIIEAREPTPAREINIPIIVED